MYIRILWLNLVRYDWQKYNKKIWVVFKWLECDPVTVTHELLGEIFILSKTFVLLGSKIARERTFRSTTIGC